MGLTKEEVITALKSCQDPEIPVNIVDLGLVYDIEINPSTIVGEQSDVVVTMTLTTQGCPMSQSISNDVHKKLLEIPSVSSARIEIVWEPAWSPDKISPDGRKFLKIA